MVNEQGIVRKTTHPFVPNGPELRELPPGPNKVHLLVEHLPCVH